MKPRANGIGSEGLHHPNQRVSVQIPRGFRYPLKKSETDADPEISDLRTPVRDERKSEVQGAKKSKALIEPSFSSRTKEILANHPGLNKGKVMADETKFLAEWKGLEEAEIHRKKAKSQVHLGNQVILRESHRYKLSKASGDVGLVSSIKEGSDRRLRVAKVTGPQISREAFETLLDEDYMKEGDDILAHRIEEHLADAEKYGTVKTTLSRILTIISSVVGATTLENSWNKWSKRIPVSNSSNGLVYVGQGETFPKNDLIFSFCPPITVGNYSKEDLDPFNIGHKDHAALKNFSADTLTSFGNNFRKLVYETLCGPSGKDDSSGSPGYRDRTTQEIEADRPFLADLRMASLRAAHQDLIKYYQVFRTIRSRYY